MRPEESFVGQPIRSLQTMLRVISEDDERSPTIIPDGIYGQQTVNAVSVFQRQHGLPVTGIADQTTWEAITAAYEPALIRVDAAEPIRVILNPGQIIRRGEKHPNMYLVQAMLTVMSEVYPGITQPNMSGTLDMPSYNSIVSFQEFSLLPVTGEVDKETWKHLALHYPTAASISARANRNMDE